MTIVRLTFLRILKERKMTDIDLVPVGRFENGIFSFPVRIYFEDTDAGGIVYYANYLKFAERARTEFLRYIGIDGQQNTLESNHCGFVVRHLEIDYITPAKLDDFLLATCQVVEEKGASLVVYQEIKRDKTVLAKLHVRVAYFNGNNGKPMRIPDEMRERLKKLL